MRFVCDSCRAQYMISDDKVGAKGVKVRCKKCSHVIHVRRPEEEPEPELERTTVMVNPLAPMASLEASPGTDESPRQETPPGGLLGASEDEIGAVFDSVLNSGPHRIPAEPGVDGSEEEGGESRRPLASDLLSTRVMNPAAAMALAEESAGEGSEGEEESREAPAAEWYVAIDEEQVGPLGLERMKDHWERGEIGPDSLCWRAGMADWVALSEVPELQRHLAPRPSRPVIVAPAPMAPASVASSAPVESAFSAGGLARSAPVLEPSAPVAAVAAADSAWKPSAASALASLVKEEMDALSKPAPAAPPPAVAAAVPGLLDVPPAEAGPVAAMGASAVAVPPMGAALAQPPAPGVAAGFAAQPVAHAAPGYVPAPAYVPAPYVGAPVAAQGRSRTGLFVALGAVVLLVGGAGVTAMVLRPWETPARQEAPAAPVAQAPAPAAAPPAAQAAAPAAPAPAAPAAPAPAAQAEPQPAPAAQQAAAPAPTPAAAPAKAEALPEAPLRGASAAPRVAEASRTESPRRRTREAPREEAQEEEEAPAPRAPEKPASDDPFDDIFGPSKPVAKKAKAEARRPEVYVPPAPGGDIPESLGQSDIMQVVLANKASIVKCVNQQKASDPDLSGKLVMRWTVLTSGKTTGVSCQTAEFKNTEMASCISGLIKKWTFPRHKRQGDAINFPFTF